MKQVNKSAQTQQTKVTASSTFTETSLDSPDFHSSLHAVEVPIDYFPRIICFRQRYSPSLQSCKSNTRSLK